jgi:cyanophycin synthetase
VDLITTDITRPWHETGAMLNELNFYPQFRWSGREEDSCRAPGALVPHGGRIPVHIVCGDANALDHARTLRAQLEREGTKCYVSSANHSEDAQGNPVHLLQAGILDRGISLLLRPDVEGLILVGSLAEFLATGFAVDRIDSLKVIEAALTRPPRSPDLLPGISRSRKSRR